MISAETRNLLESSRRNIAGTSNVRDLGGYPARDGATVRPGVLFRAEALAHPGPGAAHVALWRDDLVDDYRALGLSLVIDLRGERELTLAPSAWAEPTGADLELIPINEGGEGDATDFVMRLRSGTLRTFTAADLAAYYAATVRRRAREFGRAIAAIAGRGGEPVLVHCAAGKDRTGILIALVLDVLGVPRSVIVADYAMTGFFRPNRVAAYADMLAASGIAPADVSALFETPTEAMELLLADLDEEFGTVRQFLLGQTGLTARHLDDLTQALLTEPSAGGFRAESAERNRA